jgi:hypothetical protein
MAKAAAERQAACRARRLDGVNGDGARNLIFALKMLGECVGTRMASVFFPQFAHIRPLLRMTALGRPR